MALLAGTCVTILGGLFLDASALIPVDENGARQALFESSSAHRLVQSNSGGNRTMKYSEIFVGRTDTYARASNGGYQRVGKPLDANVLLLHRLGHIAAGIYLIRPDDNAARVIVLDIDDDEPEAVKRLVEEVLTYIPKKAIIIEKTGGRGWHIWVLFNDCVPAARLKRFGEWLLEEANPGVQVEVFPKQAEIAEGGFGNLVRLPLGKHPRTGNEGQLFHADMRPIETRPTEDRDLDLVGVEPCGPHHIPHGVASERPLGQQLPLPTPGPSFSEPLPCFHGMMEGVKEGCRDRVGFALAKHLRRQGKSREEAETLLLDWNAKNRPPLPTTQVLQKVEQAYEKGYRSLDCQDECVQQFCQPGCPLAPAAPRREWRFWSSGELGRAEIEPVQMIVEGLSLPEGGSLLLAGPPGVGKSWVALDLGICLASGEPFLGQYQVIPRNVIFFDEEGSESGTKERHDALKRGHGLDPGDDIPLWIAIKTGLRLDRQDDINRLIETIRRYEAQVVISIASSGSMAATRTRHAIWACLAAT